MWKRCTSHSFAASLLWKVPVKTTKVVISPNTVEAKHETNNQTHMSVVTISNKELIQSSQVDKEYNLDFSELVNDPRTNKDIDNVGNSFKSANASSGTTDKSNKNNEIKNKDSSKLVAEVYDAKKRNYNEYTNDAFCNETGDDKSPRNNNEYTYVDHCLL